MGLGAGAVDAGLNNFVALHYAARHMSWLHCFWGVGATLGPVILSLFLGGQHGWRGGYGAVCAIQFCLVAVLAVTLPMWDRYEAVSYTHLDVYKRQHTFQYGGAALTMQTVRNCFKLDVERYVRVKDVYKRQDSDCGYSGDSFCCFGILGEAALCNNQDI